MKFIARTDRDLAKDTVNHDNEEIKRRKWVRPSFPFSNLCITSYLWSNIVELLSLVILRNVHNLKSFGSANNTQGICFNLGERNNLNENVKCGLYRTISMCLYARYLLCFPKWKAYVHTLHNSIFKNSWYILLAFTIFHCFPWPCSHSTYYNHKLFRKRIGKQVDRKGYEQMGQKVRDKLLWPMYQNKLL